MNAYLLVCVLVLFCSIAFAQEGKRPSPDGLVLWVDASSSESLKLDAEGRVEQWRDLSGAGHHLLAEAGRRPERVEGAMNGKPVVRFAGAQSLAAEKVIREKKGSGALLIVWQRSDAQASDEKWQRLVSSRPDTAQPDNAGINFCMTADRAGEGKACPPAIYDLELTDQAIGALVVGRTAVGTWQFLRGDIAEILVYDRAFLSEGELQVSLAYLREKWGARVAREENGWTRTGLLGDTPAHTRQDLPLSDQDNAGKWQLDAQFSDEFDGDKLNTQRWHVNPTAPGDWWGREPAMFHPSNVSQKDGQLHLVFRKGEVPEMKTRPQYKDYTSALVQSNELTGYGYYEIRARPMNSAGSSAFWFYDTRLPENKTEIDVFEIGGNAPGFERKYNMNAHVWKTPDDPRHWAVGGVWTAPWRLADDYHVYGFEWNAEELVWYVDGVAVRRMKNTNWFFPMRVTFDSEAMWSWFGKVDDRDLPSTFSIDYLRVWRPAK